MLPVQPFIPLALLLALVAPAATADPGPATADAVETAGRLAQSGAHMRAETAYTRILTTEGSNVRALTGRGTVRAWQTKYLLAIEDFRAALRLAPHDREARNGLAYALAWAGRHDEAEREFLALQAVRPDDLEAQKGLAYVALWRPDPPLAVRRFAALGERLPDNPELWQGLAAAHRLTGDEAAAHAAFSRVAMLDPAQPQVTPAPAPKSSEAPSRRYELTLIAGQTRFAEGDRSSGIRSAQFALQATPDVRAWLLYDGGLGLDNRDLALRRADADAYYLGFLFAYGQGDATKVEVGRRELGDDRTQAVVRLEQSRRLASGTQPKFGVWVGKGDAAPTEYTFNAGASFPLSPAARIEPMVFHSRNAARERETRGLLFGEYTFHGGASLGLGVSGGHKSQQAGGGARREGLVLAGFPLRAVEAAPARLHFLARRESGGGVPAATLLAAGISVNF